jgi:hypothetical protein
MPTKVTLPDHPMVRVAIMLAPSTDPRHIRQLDGLIVEIAKGITSDVESVRNAIMSYARS